MIQPTIAFLFLLLLNTPTMLIEATLGTAIAGSIVWIYQLPTSLRQSAALTETRRHIIETFKDHGIPSILEGSEATRELLIRKSQFKNKFLLPLTTEIINTQLYPQPMSTKPEHFWSLEDKLRFRIWKEGRDAFVETALDVANDVVSRLEEETKHEVTVRLQEGLIQLLTKMGKAKKASTSEATRMESTTSQESEQEDNSETRAASQAGAESSRARALAGKMFFWLIKYLQNEDQFNKFADEITVEAVNAMVASLFQNSTTDLSKIAREAGFKFMIQYLSVLNSLSLCNTNLFLDAESQYSCPRTMSLPLVNARLHEQAMEDEAWYNVDLKDDNYLSNAPLRNPAFLLRHSSSSSIGHTLSYADTQLKNLIDAYHDSFVSWFKRQTRNEIRSILRSICRD